MSQEGAAHDLDRTAGRAGAGHLGVSEDENHGCSSHSPCDREGATCQFAAAWIVPVTSPKPIRTPSIPGAVARIEMVSPSWRNDRVDPSANITGSAPFQ